MVDGHIKHHPAEDLDTPQRFNYLPKFLTEDEINSLLSAPDISTEEGIRDRAILELMYATGLRVSELTGLRNGDVDLMAGLVVLLRQREAKSARVPLGKSAIHWLQQYSAVKRWIRETDITLHVSLSRKAVHATACLAHDQDSC